MLIVVGVNAPASFADWNPNGTCTLSGASPSYQQCLELGGGVPDMVKAAFTYKNASCNYASKSVYNLRRFTVIVLLLALA